MSGFWPPPGGFYTPDPAPDAAVKDGPLTMEQLAAHARVLQDELGLGWRVRATLLDEGPRLLVHRWPPRTGDELIAEPTIEAARAAVRAREEST